MKRFPRLIALLLLCVAAGFVGRPAPAADPEPGVRVQRSVVYGTAGGEKLYMDVATPPGDGPFPCVVMYHGGAWTLGSRSELSVGGKDASGKRKPGWIEVVAAKGYVAVSVGYRLAPKFKFPAMIEDARSAVRYLRANAKKFKVDPDRFASVGFSAGGHLALLVGLCDKSAGFDVGENLDVSGQTQCVVDFFGPTDLSLYAAAEGVEDGYLVPVFGKECKTDPEVFKKASPVTYVTKNAPPVLILHGTLDLIVPIKHSEELEKKLIAAADTVEMVTIPFAGHGGWSGRDLATAQTATFKFLNTYLKGKKK